MLHGSLSTNTCFILIWLFKHLLPSFRDLCYNLPFLMRKFILKSTSECWNFRGIFYSFNNACSICSVGSCYTLNWHYTSISYNEHTMNIIHVSLSTYIICVHLCLCMRSTFGLPCSCPAAIVVSDLNPMQNAAFIPHSGRGWTGHCEKLLAPEKGSLDWEAEVISHWHNRNLGSNP